MQHILKNRSTVFPSSAEAIDQNSDTLTTGVGRLTI